MNNKPEINDLINTLEINGEIKIFNNSGEIYIQSIDDKEGYSYVSNTDREFDSSKEAVEWAIEQIDGTTDKFDWK